MIMINILIVIIVIFIIIISAINCLFKYATLGKKRDKVETFENLFTMGLCSLNEYEKLKLEELVIKSKEGYNLKGYYLNCDVPSNKVIILLHGYLVGHYRSCQYINFFIKEGFNIFLVDQRGHGNSEGTYATYGRYECEDLDLWVSYIRKKIGEACFVGVHGHSMGAATGLMYSVLGRNKINFIISESGYSNVVDVIKGKLNKYKIPFFPFYNLTNYKIKKICGFSLGEVCPMDMVRKSEIPIMFIHGDEDELIPCCMSMEMYEIKKGIKSLCIIPNAKHNTCYATNKEKYEKEVKNFLNII